MLMSNEHAVSQRRPAILSVAFTWSCCNSAETEVTCAREAGGTRPSCELKPDEDKQSGAAFKGENSCDYVLQAGGCNSECFSDVANYSQQSVFQVEHVSTSQCF